ncbi:hypothetical protein GH740_07295 [Microbacterium sp. SYP-A9085]|uniref:LuxR C-terminal-related transcriptional regulator n=1 Tax=Microbacterium sp. SYP-A9085 TaxID=2664454 RepID=UPI00129ABA8A|nr:LuxR C-terminal-related transcriptional regulator [Microbacterium sp. SYP-A9085]MRH29120.1 hypothetical protein [Microbacterium sp. SYP-A9085]
MPTTATSHTAGPLRPLLTGARHAQRMVDALIAAQEPPRAFIVGSAGSGKSTVLHRVRAVLAERGVITRTMDASVDAALVPPDEVLIADDLHLLPATALHGLSERAAVTHTALIVASRPWPRTDALVQATMRLEHALPTIVAGQVRADDLSAYLAVRQCVLPADCVDDIIRITGGMTWLVTEALSVHDPGGCGDADHASLRHHLVERVAQRLLSVDATLRDALEAISLGGGNPAPGADDVIAQGFSEGLLLRNGAAIPIVRDAVRTTIPFHRLRELSQRGDTAAAVSEIFTGPVDWSGTRDAEIGRALLAEAARLADTDPVRAEALCRRALETGAPAAEATPIRARAAWAAGDIDRAAVLLDGVAARGDDPDVAAMLAAIWAARGMMPVARTIHDGALGTASAPMADITRLAVGTARPPGTPSADAEPPPTTLSVALATTAAGLRRTVDAPAGTRALSDLARASRLYTVTGSAAPVTELPAVIAAVAAVGLGEPTTAAHIISAAVAGDHGGTWARRRLLLWSGWLAIQREEPAQARECLRRAHLIRQPWTPRDRFLETAVRVALTRRYEEVADLRMLWEQVRDDVQQVTVDLFLLLPLASLVAAVARIGDHSTLQPLMDDALALLERLGSPAVWSVHLRWAGIQQGILLDEPDRVAPHAHALVDAAAHSAIAATMAGAGRIWMSVLAGHVDPDAVEEAAIELAACGLAWDGARLAGHGAARADDRRTVARLLACARQLHPPAAPDPLTPVPEGALRSAANVAGLSERELEVARLVVEGRTYAEIGRMIFISPRTAEHHIARIRQKLAATSRSDLVARLRVALSAAPADTEGSPWTP